MIWVWGHFKYIIQLDSYLAVHKLTWVIIILNNPFIKSNLIDSLNLIDCWSLFIYFVKYDSLANEISLFSFIGIIF